jgi:hypothetical protein
MHKNSTLNIKNVKGEMFKIKKTNKKISSPNRKLAIFSLSLPLILDMLN